MPPNLPIIAAQKPSHDCSLSCQSKQFFFTQILTQKATQKSHSDVENVNNCQIHLSLLKSVRFCELWLQCISPNVIRFENCHFNHGFYRFFDKFYRPKNNERKYEIIVKRIQRTREEINNQFVAFLKMKQNNNKNSTSLKSVNNCTSMMNLVR